MQCCARLLGRVMSAGRWGGGVLDVALNSLLRASLSLKLSLSFRALKQLDMAKLRVFI